MSQKAGTTTIQRKLCTSLQCALVATKANHVLSCIIKIVPTGEESYPLFFTYEIVFRTAPHLGLTSTGDILGH